MVYKEVKKHLGLKTRFIKFKIDDFPLVIFCIRRDRNTCKLQLF